MKSMLICIVIGLALVPTMSFGGWFDFLEGDDKPETPSQQQISIAQINQWRKEVGLPPVTGNLASDRPMLERECATGIQGSCQLIGQTVQSKTQCIVGLISVGNFCCTPDFSTCVNPNTGQMLQVPFDRGYGGYNDMNPSSSYDTPERRHAEQVSCETDCTRSWYSCVRGCRYGDDRYKCSNKCDDLKHSCELRCR